MRIAIKERIEDILARLDETRVPSNEELTRNDQQAEVGTIVYEQLVVGALEKSLLPAKGD